MKIKMNYKKIYELVLDLEKLQEELKDDNIIALDFGNSNFINPWVYLIISSWIIHNKSNGLNFNFKLENINNKNVVDYASRINFFDLIGYKYKENFIRHKSKGKFIPLNKINSNNLMTIPTEITKIFINLCNLESKESEDENYNIMYMIEYCLTEVIENIDRHSEAKTDGLIIVQPYKNNEEIDVCVVDTGIGIPNALRKTEKYRHLTDKECVMYATDKNIKTEGLENEGQGNGLYILKKLIKSMSGELRIISGNGAYVLNHNQETTFNLGCKWGGTIVQFKYKYSQKVDIRSIMGGDYTPYSTYLDGRIDLSSEIDEYLNF